MKLPDIRIGRQVPALASAKAAALPGKLRTIEAQVGLADRVADETLKVVESEAKLDAARRMNTAKRGYQSAIAAITQEYHTDRDKPLSNYATDLRQAKDDAFKRSTTGASGRVNKILRPVQDNFSLQTDAIAIEAVQKLTVSRSIMHLNDIGQDELQSISEGGDVYEAAASYADAVEISPLDAETKQSSIQKYIAIAAEHQINIWGNEDDIKSMMGFTNSGTFNELSPTAQQSVKDQITVTATGLITKAQNLAGTEVTLGNWSIEQGISHVGTLLSEYTDIKENDRLKMVEALGYDMFTQRMDGLLAVGGYQEVLDTLRKGDYNVEGRNISPKDKVSGWISSATRGLTMATTASTTLLFHKAEEGKKGAADGVQVSNQLIAELSALKSDSNVSATKREQAQILLAELEALSKATEKIGAIPTVPTLILESYLPQLQQEKENLKSAPTGIDYSARKKANDTVTASIQSHLKNRKAAPVDYAITNHPQVREAWVGFREQWMQYKAGKGNFQDAQMAYAQYSARLNATMDQYLTPQAGRSTLPNNSVMSQFLVDSITKGSPSQVRASMTELGAVMGIQGMQDFAASIKDTDPSVAMILAFNMLPNSAGVQSQDALLAGMQIRKQQQGSIPTGGEFKESLANSKIEVPYSALGEFGVMAGDAIYTYSLGIASPAELSSGVFSEDTLTQARNAVIGEPFRISAQANPSLPYRKDDGTLATAFEVKNIFTAAKYSPEYAKEVFGDSYVMDINGEATTVAYKDFLEYSTPIMVENGVYEISVPASSPMATGAVLLEKLPDGSFRRKRFDLTKARAPVGLETVMPYPKKARGIRY